MENYKFAEDKIPRRSYPSNKVKNGVRYVITRNGHLSFPVFYHYHQYLVSILLSHIIGAELFNDNEDKSAFRNLLFAHIKKYVSGPQYQMVRSSNADTYLLYTASDIELLFINDLLPSKILKRLKSKSDSEMRGVIYEIAIAAAYVRAGYEVQWLTGDSLPEFSATKNVVIDIEAKRRNRVGKKEYNLEKEIHAIRQNLAKALKKKRQGLYLIFLDSDIPPKSSTENEYFYERCREEFGDYNLDKTAVIITNNGYENDQDAVDRGKNSVMVFRGKGGPSKKIIEEIILSLYAKLPEAISLEWPVMLSDSEPRI